jgi:phospholipid/cholesterol/gamma-HCH transport system substrate-binding protein
MEIRANYIVTGAFTLAVIVGVFGFIFWIHNIGGGGERASYRVVFSGSVSGLRTGGSVLFNGIRVGEVSGLVLDTQDPRRVTATISVNRAVPVRADTRVALAFQGLTGLAEVSLTGGAADAAPLVAENGAPPTLYAGASAGADVTQAARDVLSRINGLVVDNETALRSSLRNIETVTATLAQNSQRLDKVMVGKLAGADEERTLARLRALRSDFSTPPSWASAKAPSRIFRDPRLAGRVNVSGCELLNVPESLSRAAQMPIDGREI